MKKVLLTTVVAVVMGSAAFAGDIEAGKEKSVTCVACHGANGISQVPIYPNLAGQKEQYLVSSMKAYKSQERKGGNAPIMWGLMAPLSDEDIENLAAYYASLDPSGQ